MPAKPPLFRKRELVLAGTPTIYRVYVPPDEPPLPVILFLHGAGESQEPGALPRVRRLSAGIARLRVARLQSRRRRRGAR
jgi:predicted alpha/beta-hydrolase family hydrolase